MALDVIIIESVIWSKLDNGDWPIELAGIKSASWDHIDLSARRQFILENYHQISDLITAAASRSVFSSH